VLLFEINWAASIHIPGKTANVFSFLLFHVFLSKKRDTMEGTGYQGILF